LLLGLAETLIFFVSIFVGALVVMAGLLPAPESALSPGRVSLQATIFCAAMLLGMTAMGLYQREFRDAPVATLGRIGLSFVTGLLLMAAISIVLPGVVFGWPVLAVALVCSFIGIATCRLLAYRRTTSRLARRVLVLGAGNQARQIDNLRRASDRQGIEIVGYVPVGNSESLICEEKLLQPQSTLLELTERYDIDEIVVALDDRRRGIPIDAILECKMHGLVILEAAEFHERQLGKIRIDTLNPSDVIFADGFSQAAAKMASKRAFDIAASLALLVVTLPLMALAALAIVLESGWPVLYRQQRVGLKGTTFELYKFRSMRQDAEKDGVAVWAQRGDDRITRVGAIIRRLRIDELPQLISVLKGDMSFVGPRPERPQFVRELAACIPFYELRHHVKPGITGWAQISYPYGDSIKDAREKLQYDLYYLKNYSVFLDLTILVQTVEVILWRKGSR
jgi:sugar transferase (PEP-CTERM system associated)